LTAETRLASGVFCFWCQLQFDAARFRLKRKDVSLLGHISPLRCYFKVARQLMLSSDFRVKISFWTDRPFSQLFRVQVMNSTLSRCLILLTVATAAYGQNANRPEFEVASVKLMDPAGGAQVSYMPTLDVRPGGTLRISNRRLDEIIMLA